MRAKAGKTALGPIRRGPAPPPPEAIPERLSGRFRSRQLNQLTARDLMMPGVTTIVEEASLENGLRAMVAHRTHAILVTGARTGRPLGWATDRGLLAHLERDAPLTIDPRCDHGRGGVGDSRRGGQGGSDDVVPHGNDPRAGGLGCGTDARGRYLGIRPDPIGCLVNAVATDASDRSGAISWCDLGGHHHLGLHRCSKQVDLRDLHWGQWVPPTTPRLLLDR